MRKPTSGFVFDMFNCESMFGEFVTLKFYDFTESILRSLPLTQSIRLRSRGELNGQLNEY